MQNTVAIYDFKVAAYTVPTETPEADGTIEWDSTTIIIVQLKAANKNGIGYTYAHPATAQLIDKTLKSLVVGKDAMDIACITSLMIRAIRNNGTCGIAMMAVSAVDNALWDLKAKILDIPLCTLLGKVRNEMQLYGSGGFTNYTDRQLEEQFLKWHDSGITHFKMKIGTHIQKDEERVKLARKTIGDGADLYVDANGAYTAKQAISMAYKFHKSGVSWFEEPVPSDDLEGLHFIREHVPVGMRIAAGEYGYNLPYFHAMLKAKSVDVLQGDATRCGGISGFMKAGILCEAFQLPYSSHCAPALHLHAALALPSFSVAEYFYDHVRIEDMFFDGVAKPVDGCLKPDVSMPGLGLILREKDVTKYIV